MARCRVLRSVLKGVLSEEAPQGRRFLGTLAIPRLHFRYLLSVHCGERGTTGLREAIVTDMLGRRES